MHHGNWAHFGVVTYKFSQTKSMVLGTAKLCKPLCQTHTSTEKKPQVATNFRNEVMLIYVKVNFWGVLVPVKEIDCTLVGHFWNSAIQKVFNLERQNFISICAITYRHGEKKLRALWLSGMTWFLHSELWHFFVTMGFASDFRTLMQYLIRPAT